MTKDQVKYVCRKYAVRLEAKGGSPVRNIEAATVAGRIDHLRWMCDEVPVMVENSVEKAMRWLGFMQGAMAVLDVMTIEEMKEDNRAHGEDPEVPTGLQPIVDAVRAVHPEVKVRADGPTLGGYWFLDLGVGEKLIVVEWRPDHGFGISGPPHYPFAGADVVSKTADEAARTVLDFIASTVVKE